NQRRRHHRPERELAAGLRQGQAAIAADDEIRIVPVAGPLEAPELQIVGIVPHDTVEARPVRLSAVVDLDVSTLAPELAVAANPAEDVIPLRRALEICRRGFREYDRPAGLLERHALGAVGGPIGGASGGAAVGVDVASVELQVIHTPGGEQPGVGGKMRRAATGRTAAAGKAPARGGAGVFINPEPE